MSEQESKRVFVAPRYMTRFECIGSRCEDTCCHGWGVMVDKKHYSRLKHEMDHSKQDRELFQKSLKRNRGADAGESNYASIRLLPEANCPFLDGENLCSIQRRWGESMLPDGCALFPRFIAHVGDQTELSATLSCPEIARLCLLEKDSMDFVEIDQTRIPRSSLGKTMPSQAKDPYLLYFNDIRLVVLKLLSFEEYPVSIRLFFITYFAEHTRDFFYKDTKQFDELRLSEEINRITRREIMEELHQMFLATDVKSPLVMQMITYLLRERLYVGTARLRQSIEEICRTDKGNQPNAFFTDTLDQGETSSEELGDIYSRRKDRCLTLWGDRIDRYFTNYAKNYWIKEWYTDSSNLLVHAENLLVRIAILRFLLFSHPALKMAENLGDIAAQEKVLDQTAVEVFQKFSREMEHSKRFLENIQKTMEAQQMQSLAYALFLLKF